MDTVGKAIWFIETHFSGDISLDDVAKAAGVSRFCVVRAFSFATGRSVMGYVRGRRLTEAARSLANGAPDILTVALDAGYGSHEAFTRAFRDQFGLTPETVRAQQHLGNLELVNPIKLDELLSGTSNRRASRTASRSSSPAWESVTPGRPAKPSQRNGRALYRI